MHKIVSSKALGRSVGIALALLILKTSVAQAPLSARKTPPAARPRSLTLQTSSARLQAIPSHWKRKRTSLLPIVEQASLTTEHKRLSDRILRTLPSGCRDNLRNFYALYGGSAQRRGLGGKTTIILDGSVPDAEFASLLIHECGHVVHGNLTGTASAGAGAFNDGRDVFYADAPAARFFAISWTTQSVLREKTADADFVSGYAKNDAFEDFAETFAAYVLHRTALRERARSNTALAAKLAWMERELPLPEGSLGTSAYAWDGTVPWDITKLPVVLVGN